MATRFYFRESGTAPVSPAVDAGWENSGSPFARKPMFTTSDGADTLTTVSGFAHSGSSTDCAHRQFISEPMDAGFVFDSSVTYKCYIQVNESAGDDNISACTGIRIVSEDGATVRATVKTLQILAAGEWSTSLRNKAFADGDAGSATSYTTVAGDRLVLEVGGRADAAAVSPSGSMRMGSAGTGDLPENETSTATDLRPWFQTSLNLTFQAATRRAVVTWAELEVPLEPRRAIVTWAEFEIPNAQRRAIVGWSELETPNVSGLTSRAIITWAELEVPVIERRAVITWAELELPEYRFGIVSWAELEVPDFQSRRSIVTWAALEVPNLSGSGSSSLLGQFTINRRTGRR